MISYKWYLPVSKGAQYVKLIFDEVSLSKVTYGKYSKISPKKKEHPKFIFYPHHWSKGK